MASSGPTFQAPTVFLKIQVAQSVLRGLCRDPTAQPVAPRGCHSIDNSPDLLSTKQTNIISLKFCIGKFSTLELCVIGARRMKPTLNKPPQRSWRGRRAVDWQRRHADHTPQPRTPTPPHTPPPDCEGQFHSQTTDNSLQR